MGPVSKPSHGSSEHRLEHQAGHSLIADCNFDEFETHVLGIARHFFLAFAEPHSEAWVEAFRRAEQVFPVPFGATIANAILIALNDMRRSRVRTFTYTNPRCERCLQHVTDEERYLVSALRDIRRGNHGSAKTNCMLLCEGGDTSALLRALERIAIITGDAETPKYN